MFDQLQKMMENPQAREMVYKMIAQQVAQAPPETREALSRVTVTLEKLERGLIWKSVIPMTSKSSP